jgi:hypothetical protein
MLSPWNLRVQRAENVTTTAIVERDRGWDLISNSLEGVRDDRGCRLRGNCCNSGDFLHKADPVNDAKDWCDR